MKILRQTIRKLLIEGLYFRRLKNMALVQVENSGTTGYSYLLFYPEMTEYLLKYQNEMSMKELALNPHMIAMMKVSEHNPQWEGDGCLGAWEVKLVSALSGWGPTMYDIVMGDSPNGLTADRGSVSEDAYDVWDFYHKKREDIDMKPLDWNRRQWTPDTKDDCDWGADSEAWQMHNSWDDDEYDYIWDDPSIKKGDFLSDPLNWVYNRGPVPNRDILRQNGERAEQHMLTFSYWDEDEWAKLARAFFDVNDVDD